MSITRQDILRKCQGTWGGAVRAAAAGSPPDQDRDRREKIIARGAS